MHSFKLREFEIGEKVAVVPRNKFYEAIENGSFVIATVYEKIPMTQSKNFKYLYRAKSESKEIYASYGIATSDTPHEFIPINYLVETMEKMKNEKFECYQRLSDLIVKYTSINVTPDQK